MNRLTATHAAALEPESAAAPSLTAAHVSRVYGPSRPSRPLVQFLLCWMHRGSGARGAHPKPLDYWTANDRIDHARQHRPDLIIWTEATRA